MTTDAPPPAPPRTARSGLSGQEDMTMMISTESLTGFATMPADQGQMIEIAYAVDWESEMLVRRTTDHSDG